MLSNAGHAIQKMINNIPVAITSNDKTSAVVTSGGVVYQTGFISDDIRNSFHPINAMGNVGQIVDAEAVDSGIYLRNTAGYVFFYDYNTPDKTIVREVFSPVACGGDKATRIVAGSAHVLILTENKKVWGAGSNAYYQLVPQGKPKYDTAVQLLITDLNLHNNDCPTMFSGIYNELEAPIIPACEVDQCRTACIKKNLCDVLLGYVNISDVTISGVCKTGILSVPIYGDLNYVGFLCVDGQGCVSGNVTYTITRMEIKCGCFVGKFTYADKCGCNVQQLNLSSTHGVLIYEGSLCHAANTDLCASSSAPLSGISQINGKCGDCVVANIDIDFSFEFSVGFSEECHTLLLGVGECKRTTITALCEHTLCNIDEEHAVSTELDFDVKLNCGEPLAPKPEVVLPQPCWANVFAGFNTSVLVDNCDRIYVLGSMYKIRSNKDLLQKSCLEELLSKTNASVTFPADQLNCAKNKSCQNTCSPYKEEEFKTDLNKFGIHLNFPQGQMGCESMNVCDFIQQLKQCNESTSCTQICEPCDAYIYLNINGDCGCECGAPVSKPIGSVTLLNRKSVCKLVSQGCLDQTIVSADVSTIVEYDLNKYCIDTRDVALDKVVKLTFCNEGPNVNVYLDVDQPGGIRFTSSSDKCNVEFAISASTDRNQFILNYGAIVDPNDLTNLKYALALDAYYPCPNYKNPFDTKIVNTYLKGGDHVKFTVSNPKNIRLAITPDVPTVYRLNRRILDIGVGNNNLTALVGGLSCPNELFAIGSNCHGELGIGSHETITSWRPLNKGQFDSAPVRIFSGSQVTMYATQSGKIYGTGQWKCFINSTIPLPIKSICESWGIRYISISRTHMIMIGSDGFVFGLGDNRFGELGLCHTDMVKKPTPLAFFQKLNNEANEELKYGINHPVRMGDGCWRPQEPVHHHDKKGNFKPNSNKPGFQGFVPPVPMCPPCPDMSSFFPQGQCPFGYGRGGAPGPYKKYNPNHRSYGRK